MIIESYIEQRFQTAHPSLQVVSIIQYKEEVQGDEVTILDAWVCNDSSGDENITLNVDEENNGLWLFLLDLHQDARAKASKVNEGGVNYKGHLNDPVRHEYNP